MDDFAQPTGEADPFGAAGGDEAFGMAAPPLDGDDAPSAYAAEPLSGGDEMGGGGMDAYGTGAEPSGGDSFGEMGAMSAEPLSGMGDMSNMGDMGDMSNMGGSVGDLGSMGGMGDMGVMGGGNSMGSGDPMGGGDSMGGGAGLLDMSNLADPGPAPQPEGPKISEASISAIAYARARSARPVRTERLGTQLGVARCSRDLRCLAHTRARARARSKWRMEHTAMVEEKQKRESAKQQEMLANAKADLEAVIAARQDKKTKRMAVNRCARHVADIPPVRIGRVRGARLRIPLPRPRLALTLGSSRP